MVVYAQYRSQKKYLDRLILQFHQLKMVQMLKIHP